MARSIKDPDGGKMLRFSASELKALQKARDILHQCLTEAPETGELGKNGRWQLEQLLDARLRIRNLTA